MKYAIISDIHANADALESVLADIDDRRVESIICLGDIVGYGPEPDRCIDLIRGQCAFSIMGNHDHAVLGLTDTSYFNPYARRAVEWTQKQISDESRRFLLSCPFTVSDEGCFFVHASPHLPAEWKYIISRRDAMHNFDDFSERICFVGHSHIPVTFCRVQNRVRLVEEKSWQIDSDEKCIVNVGSVGQPRDNNPQSSYGIFDNESGLFDLIRVSYNVSSTQSKMKQHQLPEYLIQRLRYGR